MNLRAAFFLAYKDVFRQRKLLAIVVIALTLGICNTVLTVGLMKGFEKFISEDVVEIVAGHVVITPSEGRDRIQNAYSVIDAAESLKEVKAVFPRNYYTVTIHPTGREIKSVIFEAAGGVTLVGIDIDRESAASSLPKKISKGEFLSGEKDELILGYSLAEDFLGVGVGDDVEVNFPNGQKEIMTVTGLLKTGAQGVDMSFAYASADTLNRITGERGKYNSIMLKLYDRNQAEAVKTTLIAQGINARIQTWEEMIEYMKQVLDMFAMMLGLISGVAILAGSASVAIMMYINIINRTRQIGTLKAIGASSDFIILAFLFEALIIGIVGVIVGNFVAFLIISYLSVNPIATGGPALTFVADFNSMLSVSAVTIFLVLLASLYPSWKASKLEVIEALRYE